MAWDWVKDDDRRLIVVNLSEGEVQARVQVPWEDLRGQTWRLRDGLSDASYDRNGDEMLAPGLYVEMGPWESSIFQCGQRARMALAVEKIPGQRACVRMVPSLGVRFIFQHVQHSACGSVQG